MEMGPHRQRHPEQGAGSRDKGATNQSGGISITARALELFLVPVPIPISSNYNVFCFIYVTGHTEKTGKHRIHEAYYTSWF